MNFTTNQRLAGADRTAEGSPGGANGSGEPEFKGQSKKESKEGMFCCSFDRLLFTPLSVLCGKKSALE